MNAPATLPLDALPAVHAPLAYIAASESEPARVQVHPPNSGRPTVRPQAARITMMIRDARPIADQLKLDVQGFELHVCPTGFVDFYDDAAVKARYYPDVRAAMLRLSGALEVVVFDHNVRSAARAARGEKGVRVPVDQVHNDYTEISGPKRRMEVLEAAGRADLADRRVAFVNLWRPIVGPVHDNPLAVCSAQSLGRGDLVVTEIHHYGEDDLVHPRQVGQIYSVRHNVDHQWFYISAMRTDEVLLLKNYDSKRDIAGRYVPHTGFNNPACPSDFIARESIEARTLVVYEQPR